MSLTRRTLLALSSAVTAGVAVAGPARADSSATARSRPYFLSATGSDTGSGTIDAPWRSLDRLKLALADGTVRRGDTVRLRAGDTFYGSLGYRTIPAADGDAPPLTLTSYGKGPQPKITSAKIPLGPSSWTEAEPGIWRLDLTAGSGAYSGDTTSTSTNVGFLLVDGVIRGVRRWWRSQLADAWDFNNDSQYVYVRLDHNPSAGAKIMIAVNAILIHAQSAMKINNLHLTGSGGHGVAGDESMINTVIAGNTIDRIGGSQLGPFENYTRYGNAVQIWIGSENVEVSGNRLSDTYDVAVTYQGGQTATARGWRNVHSHHNLIEHCNQSFEIWATGSDLGSGAGFVDCSFQSNVCTGAGRSWAAAIRGDRVGKGTHLLTYRVDLPTELSVTDNVFYDALDNYSYFGAGVPSGYRPDRNLVALRGGVRLQAQRDERIEDHFAWTEATGLDRRSRFRILDDSAAVPTPQQLFAELGAPASS